MRLETMLNNLIPVICLWSTGMGQDGQVSQVIHTEFIWVLGFVVEI